MMLKNVVAVVHPVDGSALADVYICLSTKTRARGVVRRVASFTTYYEKGESPQALLCQLFDGFPFLQLVRANGDGLYYSKCAEVVSRDVQRAIEASLAKIQDIPVDGREIAALTLRAGEQGPYLSLVYTTPNSGVRSQAVVCEDTSDESSRREDMVVRAVMGMMD
jgi:hypothetical protein